MPPPDSDPLLKLARQDLSNGRLAAAQEKCLRVLTAHHHHPGALEVLGEALSGLGRHEDAVRVFNALTLMQPAIAGHWANLGTALRPTGRYEQALAAFERAFVPTDDVSLIVNAHNHFIGPKRNEDWAVYFKTSKLANKIFVLDKYLETQANVSNLMASCDVACFLSRAEGWNLGALEAMSMGMPLITTNCTAHTEFCTKENCYLVECDELEPANDGVFFDGFGQWNSLSDKQIDATVSYMRHCYDLKRAGKLEKNMAGIETAKHFSWLETARKCAEACE